MNLAHYGRIVFSLPDDFLGGPKFEATFCYIFISPWNFKSLTEEISMRGGGLPAHFSAVCCCCYCWVGDSGSAPSPDTVSKSIALDRAKKFRFGSTR